MAGHGAGQAVELYPAARRARGWAHGRGRGESPYPEDQLCTERGLLTCRVVFVVLRSVSYPL